MTFRVKFGTLRTSGISLAEIMFSWFFNLELLNILLIP